MDDVKSRLLSGLSELGYPADETKTEKLEIYYRNLMKWNAVMNLTAITDRQEVYEKHFLDSLSFIKAFPEGRIPEGIKLIDVGTGAGFPGLPIAIFCPSMKVTLMDSLAKRIRFLEDTVGALGIQNVTLVHARAEDLARKPEYREQFDLCCSRAVANLSTLSEYCLPFVKVRGMFLSYKAEKAEQELEAGKKAISLLGGKAGEPVAFTLPGTEYHRVLIPIQKIGKTPKRFPRKAGVPGKEPL